MSDTGKNIIVSRCPVCFAGDLEIYLHYDEKDKEYYCRRCCFSGTPEDVQAYFDGYISKRFKDMLKHHPFMDIIKSKNK